MYVFQVFEAVQARIKFDIFRVLIESRRIQALKVIIVSAVVVIGIQIHVDIRIVIGVILVQTRVVIGEIQVLFVIENAARVELACVRIFNAP